MNDRAPHRALGHDESYRLRVVYELPPAETAVIGDVVLVANPPAGQEAAGGPIGPFYFDGDGWKGF